MSIYTTLDTRGNIRLHCFYCDSYGIAISIHICAAVTLDHHTAQSQQAGSIVTPGIYPAAQCFEHRQGHQAGQFARTGSD